MSTVKVLVWSHDPGSEKLLSNREFNLTLDHTIEDLKESIWYRNNELVPESVELVYQFKQLASNLTLGEVLHTDVSPSFLVSLQLVVNHNLIQHRDPFPSLFDISIELADSDRRLHIREQLATTVYTIKEYVALDENMKNKPFELKFDGKTLEDDGETIQDIIGLDSAPKKPLRFSASLKSVPSLLRRFHVKLVTDSNIPTKLLETTLSNKVIDLKKRLVELMDSSSVKRTFVEQIRFIYHGRLLNDEDLLSQILDTNDVPLEPVNFHLVISSNLNGDSSFWDDLRQDDRFEFLPKNSNQTDDTTNTRHLVSDNSYAVQGVQVKLNDGKTVGLTGDSYEEMHHDGKKLYMNSFDLSSIVYEFTIETPQGITVVPLSASQCVVQNTPGHQPYLLVSTSGISKLLSSGVAIEKSTVIIQGDGDFSSGRSNGIGNVPPIVPTNANNGNNAVPANIEPNGSLVERLTTFFNQARLTRLMNLVYVIGRFSLFLYIFQFQKLIFQRPIVSILLISSMLLINFTRRDFLTNMENILRTDFGLLRTENHWSSRVMRGLNQFSVRFNGVINSFNHHYLFNLLPARNDSLVMSLAKEFVLFFVTLVPVWQIKIDLELARRDATVDGIQIEDNGQLDIDLPPFVNFFVGEAEGRRMGGGEVPEVPEVPEEVLQEVLQEVPEEEHVEVPQFVDVEIEDDELDSEEEQIEDIGRTIGSTGSNIHQE